MVSNGNLQSTTQVRKTTTSFTLPDLEKSGGISRNIYKDTRGNMYVAGMNYFIQFQPGNIKPVNTQPAIYLTDFKIFNTSYSQLLFTKRIELPYDQNFFSFEFAAPGISAGTGRIFLYAGRC
jgi:hypothetical protein